MKQATTVLPANAARLRNIIFVSNHLMSHILHFYHLVALDYVIPTVYTGAAFLPLDRPFLCPRYNNNYYITDQRILAMVGTGLLPARAVNTLTTLPGVGPAPGYANIGAAVNTYLTGQYLKALDIRRMCHEMLAIFSGRAPMCSGYTPGGISASFTQDDIDNYDAKLDVVKAFVGEPSNFYYGTAGTMMFDVVAAAHLFPEYFWIGNSYHQFIAWGWGEEAGQIPLTGDLGGIFGNMPNPAGDNRASARGYKLSAQSGAAWNPIDILKIGESIGGSRYKKNSNGTYPAGQKFLHPWSGKTQPVPTNEYSWLKSPRYDIGGGNYQPFEVGPLSRMVVAGTYFAGILAALKDPITQQTMYPLVPTWPQAGPDLRAGQGHPLAVVYALLGGGVTGGPNLSGVAYNGDSVLDRIAARAVETRLMVDMAKHFLKTQLEGSIGGSGYGSSGCTDPGVPALTTVKKGYGMSEASRGALSHWIKMKNGKIQSYQAIVPTTWNANPRDANGVPGPAEKSLMDNSGAGGTGIWVANQAEPIELPRVTHSYDFCIACAVHLISPEGEVTKVDVPALP